MAPRIDSMNRFTPSRRDGLDLVRKTNRGLKPTATGMTSLRDEGSQSAAGPSQIFADVGLRANSFDAAEITGYLQASNYQSVDSFDSYPW